MIFLTGGVVTTARNTSRHEKRRNEVVNHCADDIEKEFNEGFGEGALLAIVVFAILAGVAMILFG